jgi:hypothetical protein
MAVEARRVVTVERGTEWEDGFARPRVRLQPFAAPSVLRRARGRAEDGRSLSYDPCADCCFF